MKKLFMATAMFAAFVLISCGEDSGTNPDEGGDTQDTEWSPVDSLSLAPYNTLARKLLADGTKLYVAGDGGFIGIVDCSDPDSMALLGYLPSDGSETSYPTSMALRGNYLLCTFSTDYHYPDTLISVDISDPTKPMRVTTVESDRFPYPNTGYAEIGVCMLAGDTVALSSTTLALYRLSTNGQLSLLEHLTLHDFGTCLYGGLGNLWIGPTDWYFFGSCVDTMNHPELRIVPRGTFTVSSYARYGSEFAHIAFQCVSTTKHAYFLDRLNNTLQVLDVSDYAHPTSLSAVQLPGGLSPPEGIPDYVYWRELKVIPQGFVFLFDVDPRGGLLLLDPELHCVRTYRDVDFPYDAAVCGRRLYVAKSNSIKALPLP